MDKEKLQELINILDDMEVDLANIRSLSLLMEIAQFNNSYESRLFTGSTCILSQFLKKLEEQAHNAAKDLRAMKASLSA